MKLMKHITIALVLCAVPAMAFGQVADCEDCDHQLSVYRSGGLVATAAGDAEMVNYRATCNNVTRTGQMTPNDDGIVNKVLTGELACDADDGTFELGPITDGGWFWIHIGDNSAVGNIVASDVLMNAETDITDPGDSITMMEGAGAVLLTHPATGRTGLLPTILPEPHMEPVAATPCGAAGAGTASSPFTRVDSECMMGDGGTIVLANYTDSISGATTRIMDGGTVTRPAGTGSLSITVDLWGNGTGAFFNGTDGGTNGINFARGNAHLSGAMTRHLARYTGVTYTVSAGSGVGGGSEISSGTALEGVDHAAPTQNGDNAVAVSVIANDANCSTTNNFPTPVTVSAIVADGDTGAEQVTPAIARAATSNIAGTLKFTVVCPTASANMGQELVPENPFPTDK